MKLSCRSDIEAPLDFVFDRVADFGAIERQVLRRGIEVERVAAGSPSGLDMAWKARVRIHGRRRDIAARVSEIDPPNGYAVEGASDGLVYTGRVETMPLSRGRTRLIVGIDLRPSSLSARLFIQSLKLAKGTITEKFQTRIKMFSADIEDRYAAQR